MNAVWQKNYLKRIDGCQYSLGWPGSLLPINMPKEYVNLSSQLEKGCEGTEP